MVQNRQPPTIGPMRVSQMYFIVPLFRRSAILLTTLTCVVALTTLSHCRASVWFALKIAHSFRVERLRNRHVLPSVESKWFNSWKTTVTLSASTRRDFDSNVAYLKSLDAVGWSMFVTGHEPAHIEAQSPEVIEKICATFLSHLVIRVTVHILTVQLRFNIFCSWQRHDCTWNRRIKHTSCSL